MAMAFPLSLTEFADGLRVRSSTPDLGENQVMSETGGGELIVADAGPRLWGGSIAVAADTPDGQRRAQALATALRQGGRSFMFCDPRGRYPASDPDGSELGDAEPALSSPAAGASVVSLTGLPAGYTLTGGDYLAFEYGSPARYALHQVVLDAAADADGAVELDIVPPLRPGAADGAAVSLINPSCRAVMVPGSFKPSKNGLGASEGFSFQWRQTLR